MRIARRVSRSQFSRALLGGHRGNLVLGHHSSGAASLGSHCLTSLGGLIVGIL